MRRLVRALPAAAILLAAARPAAAPTPSPALLVLSKGDHVLSIVDPATRAVVAQMPSGPDPHEVEASADGRMAYVTNARSVCTSSVAQPFTRTTRHISHGNSHWRAR